MKLPQEIFSNWQQHWWKRHSRLVWNVFGFRNYTPEKLAKSSTRSCSLYKNRLGSLSETLRIARGSLIWRKIEISFEFMHEIREHALGIGPRILESLPRNQLEKLSLNGIYFEGSFWRVSPEEGEDVLSRSEDVPLDTKPSWTFCGNSRTSSDSVFATVWTLSTTKSCNSS